jgi:acyl-CoA thioesterase-1
LFRPSTRIIQTFLRPVVLKKRLRADAGRGFLVACLLLFSTASAAAPRLLVLGDSISAAYGMSLESGWVALLDARLKDEGLNVEVINASISGETSAGGRRRLPGLLETHRPDAVIIELGGNDGLRGYPVASLRENLSSMASAASEVGARVLLLPMEIPPNYGSRYTQAFRDSFREAAQASDARLGPFVLAEIATDPALMQDDGIHPTREAQPKIADLLLPHVKALLDH